MLSLQPFVSSSDYIIALRALGDIAHHHLDSTVLDSFEAKFHMTPKPDDFALVLRTLKDLLIEFPATTEPEAMSAKRQARAVLKKYEGWDDDGIQG